MSTDYPRPPWSMAGDGWISMFQSRGAAQRPSGLYAIAFVHYVDPSPLTYHELLVARMTKGKDSGRRVTITDIWVDSAASMQGGRDLWAIPKQMCEFGHDQGTPGLTQKHFLSASSEGEPIATASFADMAHRAPRVPLKGGTVQHRDDGAEVRADLKGSARSLPARSQWDINPDGSLGWLAGARKLGSFRMSGFRMDFGV